MKTRTFGSAAVAIVAVGALGGGYLAARRAAAVPAATPAERRQVELTIYNQDFGLVREVRPVDLRAGRNRLAVPEVSREMDPQSVLLRWEGGGSPAPETVSHAYDLGIASSQDLLSHEVGRAVEIVRYGESGREASRERGRLLAAEAGKPSVVEVGGKLYVNPQGTLVVAGDDAASLLPQLSVQVESPSAAGAAMDLAYLTRGLSWGADYIATLARGEDRMILECYATVTNRTGVRFPEAAVTLVAGAPNRAVQKARERVARQAPGGGGPPASLPAAAEPRDESPWNAVSAPEAVGDLHAYPLKSAATVHPEQLNRLRMLRREGLKVRKTYTYRAPHLDPYGYYGGEKGSVNVALAFDNDADAGLGAPLPQGEIRVYEPDAGGRIRYAGAASVPATPKGKGVNVTIASAFDVTADYKVKTSRAVSKRKVRREVEVLLRNDRPEPVEVRVVQGFFGGWNFVSGSLRHAKPDSATARWTVPVPAGETARLTYTVDLAW